MEKLTNKEEINKLQCQRCKSYNTKPYELQDQDNPEDDPLICFDCGYGT